MPEALVPRSGTDRHQSMRSTRRLGDRIEISRAITSEKDMTAVDTVNRCQRGVDMHYFRCLLCNDDIESMDFVNHLEAKFLSEHLRRIQVKDIVKEVEDYLKTYSSVGMDVNWFLVYIDGLKPYLLEVLENGPFVPMSPLSTSINPLTKPLNQWSHEDRNLANQDKRLKSIIISCLPNDVMKSVIKCTTAKAIWTDLILAHAIPSNIRDTKIAALRLKFNAFKAFDGEKVQGTYTRLKASSSKALISNTYLHESDSDVEEDNRSSSEFLADLNAEFHDRAFLANQKRFYKRSGRDEESVSFEDEGVTRVKAFMAIAEDDPSIGKANARSVLGNIVHALGGRGKRKDQISSKEVLFTKADESPTETTPEITPDSESECDIQESL
ncbi:hypothetical protein Tco_0323002 [Tanacetum coccineum]